MPVEITSVPQRIPSPKLSFQQGGMTCQPTLTRAISSSIDFTIITDNNTTIYVPKYAETKKELREIRGFSKLTKATRRWLIVFSPRRVASTHGRGQDRTHKGSPLGLKSGQ